MSIPNDTKSRCSAVSSGPSSPPEVTTGSGSHVPETSWCRRAEPSCFRHRLVTTVVSHARGSATFAPAAIHRSNAVHPGQAALSSAVLPHSSGPKR